MLDLTKLCWDVYPVDLPGTGGSYLKCTVDNTYYKLSSGDVVSGIYGHESVNECIVSDIMDMLGIPHVRYSGERANVKLGGKVIETFVCWSENFIRPGESKIKLDTFYELPGRGGVDDVLQFCSGLGFAEDVDRLMLCDFLFINRDRHGANIELYKSDSLRMMPIFDNGLSLVAPLQNNTERIAAFDPMTDCTVNNYIGSRSLFSNLECISKPINVDPITENDILGVVNMYAYSISAVHIGKIAEIIWRRYLYARDNGFLCAR